MKSVPSVTLTESASDRQLINLVTKLQGNANLFRSRLTLTKIKELMKRGQCLFFEDEENLCGFVAIWATKKRYFYEIGPIWIDEEYRRYGLAGKLFWEIILRHTAKRLTLFLITKSEIVSSIVTSHGWSEAKDWKTCRKWTKVYQPLDGGGDRTPHDGATLYYTTLK